MPKEHVDYSNTIIYKIYCKDPSVNDIYVGHTTNFTQRKYAHKVCCNNETNKTKIYKIMRNNGGWENWEMEEIARYNCCSSLEAKQKENHHYLELKANMNSLPPCSDKLLNYCSTCNIQYNNYDSYNTHLLSQTHLDNHEINNLNYNGLQEQKYKCDCGKEYKHRQGLWKHNRICKGLKVPICSKYDKNQTEIKMLTNLVLEVVKQNKDLINTIVDLYKNGHIYTADPNSN